MYNMQQAYISQLFKSSSNIGVSWMLIQYLYGSFISTVSYSD